MKRVRRFFKKNRRECLGFVLGVMASVVVVGLYTMSKHEQTPLPYRQQGVTIPWLSTTFKKWSPEITAQAKKYNIDANFVAIIMTLESGGNPKANSGVAKGLMQVTDYTAKDIAARYLQNPVKTYDLYDPKTSIEFGVSYLAHLRDVFCDYKDGPSWSACTELIAAGYNGGPGAANSLFKGEGLTDTETVIYSRNAFNMWREKAAEISPTFDRWKEAGGQNMIDAAKKQGA